jgi:dolichol-phosphate mannosyltransferase
LLAALTDADLVVASRPAPPDDPTPRWRDDYARAILRMDVRDATSGFRALRADLVRALPLREIAASGRSFPVEVVWRSVRAGFRVHAVTLAEDAPPADSALRRIVRCGLRGRR